MTSTGQRLELVVSAKRTVADDVVDVELLASGGAPLPRWQPGAHIDLQLGYGLVRQYSLCGDPRDRGTWRIAVLREPEGRGGSRWVHDELEVGATISAVGPRNRFVFEPAPRYVLIAGGVGITPILPMALAADRAGADWTLIYGGRTHTSMAYADMLATRYGDRVHLFPQDVCGLLDLASLVPEPDGSTLVYCCGPVGLLDAIQEHARHWHPGDLRIERFTAAADRSPNRPFQVELRRSNRRLTVPADQSLLQTVRQHGVVVPSSCEEGTCGTCLTTVLAGTVDHRDAVLTDSERSAHNIMTICVSRALGGDLVLDL